jgi:hypothetical protein
MNDVNGPGLHVAGQSAITTLLEAYASALNLWDEYPPPDSGEERTSYLACRSRRATQVLESCRRLLAAPPVGPVACLAEAARIRDVCTTLIPVYARRQA